MLPGYRVALEIDRTLDRENSIVTHDAGAPRGSIIFFYAVATLQLHRLG